MSQNPYARLRSLCKITQREFSAKYRLGRTILTHIESGQVPELTDRMIVALGEECYEKGIVPADVLLEEYYHAKLSPAYSDWQKNERMAAANRFQIALTGRADSDVSPFAQLVADVAGSQYAFCTLLKVPTAQVTRYATGSTRTMPKVIEDALRDVRFPYLSDLHELQERWASK